MIDLSAARTLVQDHLAAMMNDGVADDELDIVISGVEEHYFGWVFYYDSRKFIETQDDSHRVLGNAPCIVERETGRLIVTGTAEPIESYLLNYRETGDPHGAASTRVQLLNFNCPGRTIEAIKATRKHCQHGLAAAKKAIDECLTGGAPIVQAVSVAHARELIDELSSIGCESRRVSEE